MTVCLLQVKGEALTMCDKVTKCNMFNCSGLSPIFGVKPTPEAIFVATTT